MRRSTTAPTTLSGSLRWCRWVRTAFILLVLPLGACSDDDTDGGAEDVAPPDGSADGDTTDDLQPDSDTGIDLQSDSGIDIFSCELGLEPLGEIIDWGSSQDYLLEFRSTEDDTLVNIARLYETWGVGESKVFRLGGFAMVRGEELVCITSESALTWENSHHNWLDVAVAVGEARYVFEMTYDFEGGGWTYVLTAYAAPDAVLFGPIDLEMTAGTRWP